MELDSETLDAARDSTLVENTAQSVFKHLDRLEDNRRKIGNRWIWELLQNARDAAPDTGSVVEIELTETALHFRHNGRPFDSPEITHLIYHGSTKVDGSGDLDHFGSGFLSTHLLSRVVHVRGRFTGNSSFAFDLDRSGSTVDALHDAMDRSWHEFKESKIPTKEHMQITTEFAYDLASDTRPFAQEGIESLQNIGHLALAFSPEIHSIEFRTESKVCHFSRAGRQRVTDSIEMLKFRCLLDGVDAERLVATSQTADGVQVVLPLTIVDQKIRVDLDPATPRLFVLFPLVTTEALPLPAIINSKRFKPREDRDGIWLDGDTERIAENKALLEAAAPLIIELLAFGADQQWDALAEIVRFDISQLPDWVDRDWFIPYLRQLLLKTRHLPLVVTVDEIPLSPARAWIPYHEQGQCRDAIFNLALAMTEGSARMPQFDHGSVWYENLRSWANLIEAQVLEEKFTINRLTTLTDHATTVEHLTRILVPGQDAYAWLRQLIELIQLADGTAILDQCNVLPNQVGLLRRRSELRYDTGISEALKTIADQLGVDLRDKLLDSRVAIDEVVELLTPKSEEEALDDVLSALGRKCVDETLLAELQDANVSLFWWLASSSLYRNRLDGYPIITAELRDDRIVTFVLRRDRERAPLAPFSMWPKSTMPFTALFPRRKVLHDLIATADAAETSTVWTELEDSGFVRRSPIFSTTRKLDRYLADASPLRDDDDQHRSTDEVEITDIAFLAEDDIGLIDLARKSKARAIQLVNFIVASVLLEDVSALQEVSVECDCGASHLAYTAGWLILLADRKWVPDSKGSSYISAESLAKLLSGQDAVIEMLASDVGGQLLKAIGVSPADFQLRVVAAEEGERVRLVRSMGEIARAAGGDIYQVEMLASEIRDNPGIFSAVQEARIRRAKVRSNQQLGELVEDLLAKQLASCGLTVRRTGVGSDFEVESDFTADNNEILLEVAGHRDSTLIEVKSTRSDRVRMTPTQARTAYQERGRFALWVVPLLDEAPTSELVRQTCKFVFDIGVMLEQPLSAYSSVAAATDGVRQPSGDIDVEIADGQVRFAVYRHIWLDGLGIDAAVERIAQGA